MCEEDTQGTSRGAYIYDIWRSSSSALPPADYTQLKRRCSRGGHCSRNQRAHTPVYLSMRSAHCSRNQDTAAETRALQPKPTRAHPSPPVDEVGPGVPRRLQVQVVAGSSLLHSGSSSGCSSHRRKARHLRAALRAPHVQLPAGVQGGGQGGCSCAPRQDQQGRHGGAVARVLHTRLRLQWRLQWQARWQVGTHITARRRIGSKARPGQDGPIPSHPKPHQGPPILGGPGTMWRSCLMPHQMGTAPSGACLPPMLVHIA